MTTCAYGSVREIMAMCRERSSNRAGVVRKYFTIVDGRRENVVLLGTKTLKIMIRRKLGFLIVRQLAILG